MTAKGHFGPQRTTRAHPVLFSEGEEDTVEAQVGDLELAAGAQEEAISSMFHQAGNIQEEETDLVVSVKTIGFFLRDFTRATTPSNTLKYHFYLPSHTLLCYLLSCVSKPFRLSLDHALTSHADSKVILLTCTTSLHLLLHLFLSLWLSGIVSQLSTIRLHFRFFFTIHSQHLGLDWDLDSSRRLSNPSCPL